MRTFTVFLLLALCLAPAAASADRMDIRKPAYEQSAAYEADGYSVKDAVLLGELSKGASYYFDTQLTTGLSYFFHFQGDAGVRGLRLEIYDENWERVAEYETQGEALADPVVVKLTPQWSGTFHVKATMVDCVEDFDYWFILAGFK